MLGWILFIIWIPLTGINLFIYHRMFPARIYFGNPFKAKAWELFGAAVVGILEIAVGWLIIGGLFSLLGTVLSFVAGGALFLLRIIIVFVVAAAIIFGVYMLTLFIKSKLPTKDGESGETTPQEAAAKTIESVKNKASDITNKLKSKGEELKVNDSAAAENPSSVQTDDSTTIMEDNSSNMTDLPKEDNKQKITADVKDEIICPNCGQKITKGKKFCMYCGSKLPVAKVCPNCGKEISDTARFCVFCGTKITDDAQPDQAATAVEQLQTESNDDNISATKVQTEFINDGIDSTAELDQYIVDHFDTATKVQAIQYYRQHTGLGLKEAKDKIDILLKDRN